MTTVRAAVCTGLNEPWKTEELEVDPPANREIRVKMVYSGMCHSDEHLRTGDISAPPEGRWTTGHLHRRPVQPFGAAVA